MQNQMETNKTDDVFGISRDLPLNYTERNSADTVLVNGLTRDKHLVIYGSSKQGKTCLRKHCLQDDDYVVVHCSNKWMLRELHTAILKQAGFEVTVSNTVGTSGKKKVCARLSIIGGGAETESQKTTTTAPLELEPEDVNDIIRALLEAEFSKYVVLEDFHYLPTETQKDFSVALKAFHENSKICFIVIGVWLEENRLTVHNGDLTGRVLSINADQWNREELKEVIRSGEKLLNIAFDEEFKNELLDACFNSVYIVQEACHKSCITEGIFQTQSERKNNIGVSLSAREIVKEIVNQQTGRFNSFLTQFADGFQATELEMYKWLLYPVLVREIRELERGLRQKDIRDMLREKHPRGTNLNPGNVTQALQSVAELQIRKGIKPIVLDYDQTNTRLRVVDRAFLIWLDNQDRKQLLEMLELPKE